MIRTSTKQTVGRRMDQKDVERIARAAMKELGESSDMTIAPVDGQPGIWRIDYRTSHGPGSLKIKCGQGTTPQWVREQIFDQMSR
jgi:hypothetical protein